MLPQIATAVRTDCDHLEAGPSSVDAQSKDRKGSAVLSPALGTRCWRDRPETAGISWLWPWPRLGQFCLRGGLVAFPVTRTLDLSALVTLVFVDRDTSSHLAEVRPTNNGVGNAAFWGQKIGFNSLPLRETSYSLIGLWHPWRVPRITIQLLSCVCRVILLERRAGRDVRPSRHTPEWSSPRPARRTGTRCQRPSCSQTQSQEPADRAPGP